MIALILFFFASGIQCMPVDEPYGMMVPLGVPIKSMLPLPAASFDGFQSAYAAAADTSAVTVSSPSDNNVIHVNLYEGDRFQIDCVADYKPRWEIMTIQKKTINNVGRYIIHQGEKKRVGKYRFKSCQHNNTKFFTLIVPNIDMKDMGEYRCHSNNKNMITELSVSANIHLHDDDARNYIYIKTDVGNNETLFALKSTDFRDVMWRKCIFISPDNLRNQRDIEFNESKISIDKTPKYAKVNIQDIRREDLGWYVCYDDQYMKHVVKLYDLKYL